ncbi:MAG: hypothetical protein DWQ05_00180 [Calditrichaeota bacterium]|nr:MAG: hypothetical protein DWQ05_00180 [Calditrichota bacterium]
MNNLHKTFFILLIASLFFSGCYTLLKHPTLNNDRQQRTDFDDIESVQFRSDCIECHSSSADYYNKTLPYGHYYGNKSDRWLFYYDSPWWVQPFYYGGSAPAASEGAANPRKFGRRGATNPDAPATVNTPAAPAPNSSSGTAAKRSDGSEQPTVKKEANEDKRRHARTEQGQSTQKEKASKRTRKKED